MRFHWDSSLATGVPTLDAQHQQLIRGLNSLLTALSTGKSKEEVEKMLASVADFAAHHFAYEEACMAHHECPAAVENQSAHAEFVNLFSEFRRRVGKHGVTAGLALEVERQLCHWVREHIGHVDVQLGRTIRREVA